MRFNTDADFLTLRYQFYDLLDAWRREKLIKYHGSTPHHLAELLGFRNIDYLMDDGNTDAYSEARVKMACIRPSNIWQHEILHKDMMDRPATMNNDKIDERLLAGQRLRFWAKNGHIPFIEDVSLPDHLARLLGHESYTALMRDHNDRDTELLRALVGEHGLTIYKVLVIRSGNDQVESE